MTHTRDSVPLLAYKQYGFDVPVPERTEAATAAGPVHAYGPDGAVNAAVFGNVMEAVTGEAQQLARATRNAPASAIAKAGVSTLQRLHDTLDDPKATSANRSLRNYDGLKKAAWQFDMAARLASADDRQPLESMSHLLTQLARVEFHQRGVTLYDQAADAASAKVLKRQPQFNDVLNSTVTDTLGINASGGATFGLAAGDGAQTSLAATLGLDHTALDLFTTDLDSDNIRVHGAIDSATLSVNAAAGLGVMASAGGNVKVKETHAKITETPGLEPAYRKATSNKRDREAGASADKVRILPVSGHGAAAGLHAIGHNVKAVGRRWVNSVVAGKAGEDLPPEAVQQRRDAHKATNVSAFSPAGKAAGWLSSAAETAQQVVTRTSAPPRGPRELTAPKLWKGSVAQTVPAIAEDAGMSRALQDTLQAAYGALPLRDKPKGYERSVLTGEWKEASVGIGGEFKTKAVSMPKGFFNDLSLSVKGNASLAWRNLPVQIHMAPHNFVDPSLVGPQAPTRLGDLRASEGFQAYLAYADHLAGQSDPLKSLTEDLDAFRTHANRLLTGAAMAGSKQGAIDVGARLAESAHAELAQRFFPGLDCSSHKDEALHDPGKFIARCWNALSLGTREVGTRLNADGADTPSTKALEHIRGQVEDPQLMMSSDVLHAHSVLPATGELSRRRTTLNLTAQMPVPVLNKIGQDTMTAGVTLTHDAVHGHPNPVRNGRFLQLDIDLSGMPPVPIAADKLVAAVKGLESHPEIRHNLGGLNLALSIPEAAKWVVGQAAPAATPDGTPAAAPHTMGVEGGLSFTGGHRYTLMFHKPNSKPEGDDGAPTDDAAAPEKTQWRPMLLQLASTNSVDASLGLKLNVAHGVGGNAKVGVASSNSETKPTLTAFYPEPAMQLLQYGTFKNQFARLGLMDDQGALTLGEPRGGEGSSAKDTEALAHLVTQKYFSNDCLPDVVSQLLAIRRDTAATGQPSASARDDFSVLAREDFNKPLLKRYVDDANAVPALDLETAINRAKLATQGMSAAQKFAFYTDGKSADGALITKEYVRGMNAFNAMKGQAFFQGGQEIKAPFTVQQLNPSMAMPLSPSAPQADRPYITRL